MTRFSATHGAGLSAGLPVHQLAGRDFRYVALTEYDAAADDIDGEGSLFALASKRTERRFSALAKCWLNQAVRREYRDGSWRRSVPHEAPARESPPSTTAAWMCWLHWQCSTAAGGRRWIRTSTKCSGCRN